jgi:hypothetical protein
MDIEGSSKEKCTRWIWKATGEGCVQNGYGRQQDGEVRKMDMEGIRH